jgi:hypothetical protein
VFAYDPADDAWTELPPLSRPRTGHGVAYDPVGRRLYVVAGFNDGWLASLESLAIPAR